MRRSRASVILSVFFALSVIGAPRLAFAQDMPPILAPPAPAVQAAPPQASPSAQAVIPPKATAAAVPATKPLATAVPRRAVANHRVASAAEKKRFAALLRRLAAAHRESVPRVLVRGPDPNLPPGAVVPPPYYPPGPYQRLVYGGPYSGWAGYRRPYPYYP